MRLRAMLCAALCVSAVATVAAGPITFTISTSATGTLGGTPFTDVTLTYTQVTDTTLIASCGSGVFCSPEVAGNTVTIAGLGTATITDPSSFFDNQNVNGAGYTPVASDILTEFDPAFATYDLTTNLGPISDTIGASGVTNQPTSAGLLTFTSTSLNATFQAVTGVSTAPEPGSLGLMLVGAVALGAIVLRRRRYSTSYSTTRS